MEIPKLNSFIKYINIKSEKCEKRVSDCEKQLEAQDHVFREALNTIIN